MKDDERGRGSFGCRNQAAVGTESCGILRRGRRGARGALAGRAMDCGDCGDCGRIGTTTPPLFPGRAPRAGALDGLTTGDFPGLAAGFCPAGFSLARVRAGTLAAILATILAARGRFALTADLTVATTFLAEDLIALGLALSILFLAGRADAAFRAEDFAAAAFGAALAGPRREDATGLRVAGRAVTFLGRTGNFLVLLDFAAGMQRSSLWAVIRLLGGRKRMAHYTEQHLITPDFSRIAPFQRVTKCFALETQRARQIVLKQFTVDGCRSGERLGRHAIPLWLGQDPGCFAPADL